MRLTETELRVAMNACRVAAEVFDKDANTASGPSGERNRIEEQFSRQAAEARALADKIEAEIG